MKKLNLDNIDKKIINNAANEKYAQKELAQLRRANGGIHQDIEYAHFLSKHRKDLAFYKQDKKIGYNVIVLYKNVTVIFVADFMTGRGKEVMRVLEETKEWDVYPIKHFFEEVLKKNFSGNSRDKRSRCFAYKPRAQRICEDALNALNAIKSNMAD